MKRRIFIAVNLPQDIKTKLLEHQGKWPELPVRWTKKDNLHITLVFIGYITEEEILEVCKNVKEIASKQEPFTVSLKKIIYGPKDKKPPRMIWVEGKENNELGKLQKKLENSVLNSPVKGFEAEARPYTPHITLGRINAWDFRRMEPEERPKINEEIDLTFEVNSIEIMESNLKRGGPEYTVLESAPLGRF